MTWPCRTTDGLISSSCSPPPLFVFRIFFSRFTRRSDAAASHHWNGNKRNDTHGYTRCHFLSRFSSRRRKQVWTGARSDTRRGRRPHLTATDADSGARRGGAALQLAPPAGRSAVRAHRPWPPPTPHPRHPIPRCLYPHSIDRPHQRWRIRRTPHHRLALRRRQRVRRASALTRHRGSWFFFFLPFQFAATISQCRPRARDQDKCLHLTAISVLHPFRHNSTRRAPWIITPDSFGSPSKIRPPCRVGGLAVFTSPFANPRSLCHWRMRQPVFRPSTKTDRTAEELAVPPDQQDYRRVAG